MPHTGLFSQLSQHTWRDFSWGYDALTAMMERTLGLRAIPAMAVLFRAALAVLTFLLAGGRRGRFWIAVLASAAAQFAFSLIPPGPANCSLLLFGIELLILLDVRENGLTQNSFLLPIIILGWANLDTGFVYGVALILLFAVSSSVEGIMGRTPGEWVKVDRAKLSAGMSAKILLACILASFCNPYGYHVYESFFNSVSGPLYGLLPSYASMSFHRAQDYLLLLLTMCAAMALGVRRSRDLFMIGLLVTSAFTSFHAERDSWLVGLASLAVIGRTASLPIPEEVYSFRTFSRRLIPAAAGICLLLAGMAFFLFVPSNRAVLLQRVGEEEPVRACDYIREHKLPRPLFNPYEWGGFVSWYLPGYPVSIDQRRGLYPEEEEINYFKVMNAEIAFREYVPISRAYPAIRKAIRDGRSTARNARLQGCLRR